MRVKRYGEFLAEGRTSMESAHDIGDEVSFFPMARHCKRMSIERESMTGRIVAVRHTAAKVFYDIVDDYHGIVFDNVDSAMIEAAAEAGSAA